MSQSGVTISEGGAPFTVVKDLARSSLGAKQALVKSAYVSLNPVDTMMQKYGILIHDWPAVIGSDFCAQVIETGPECTKVKKGDYVYGVCPIGQKAYSPFQETLLVDEDLVFKIEGALTPAQASTIAVGTITSAFGISVGAKVPLPAPGTKAPERDEWLIVLGGSGTVGHYAIQIGRLCGYKVAASCSASNKSIAMGFGAQAAINNRATPEEQAAEVKPITGGKYSIVFDASGLSHEAAAKMLEATTASPKYYTTVESNQHDMPAGATSYYVLIAKLGQDDELGKQVTEETKKMIPSLQAHVVSGALTPLEPEVYSGTGFESLVKALGDFGEGKTKGKVVTAAFVLVWTLVHRHVASHGPVLVARKAVMLNSWFYSLASAVLLGLMFVPQYEHAAGMIYHLSKFYEYVDVLGVRAGGGEIELHFAVHHLTTPYLTYVRVLYYSQGWKAVAAPNAFHHVLMYAYFGGVGALRSVLPVTGTIQLLLGLGGEAWLLWKKRVDGEQPLWPHEFAVSLFGIYFVLWLRELRQKASIKGKVAKFKSA